MPGHGQLSRLLTRWVELRLRGNPISVEELCADSPELIAPMRRQVEGLRLLPAEVTPPTLGDTPPAVMSELPATKDSPGGGQAATGPESSPSIPGYQLLGELGRGGGGVVYLARQASLDRLVALKVLLTGAFADSVQRARLQGEARAAARLRHPNIVQVFETGEHAGLPHLTLEFIEGGNLARRLKDSPLSPHETAALVETLARAVEAAHQDGIIHRDLKPANVLLGLDGTPKITDFGVAKRLDADASQTRTGTILGTPGYMAPEQAAGAIKEIGPRTDVYGLGAILYECLTGRPPFRAATHELTILEVLTRVPKAPRRLRASVPSELEAICLKCLSKEPADRYATAGELADDLRRFREGIPPRARPVGRLRRAFQALRGESAALATIAVNALVVIAVVLLGSLGSGPSGGTAAMDGTRAQLPGNPVRASIAVRPPQVRILAPTGESALEAPITVEFEATDAGGGIDGPWLYLNGKRVVGTPPAARHAEVIRRSIKIALDPGENLLEARAACEGGATESTPHQVRIYNGWAALPAVHVIAVGVSRYHHEPFNRACPARDAKAVADLFERRGPAFYHATHVSLLVDEQATRAGLLNAIDAIARKARPEDTLIVFLAGRGTSASGQDYFLPGDFRRTHAVLIDEDIRRQGVGSKDIAGWLSTVSARNRALILDLYQGPDTAELAYVDRWHAGFRGLAEAANPGGGAFTIATAAPLLRAGSAIDDMRHGALTHALLAGLGEINRGPLAEVAVWSVGQDQVVGISEWFEFAKDHVSRVSAKCGVRVIGNSRDYGFPVLPIIHVAPDKPVLAPD